MESCTVGICTGSECHRLVHARKMGLMKISTLTEEERILLVKRLDTDDPKLADIRSTICLHHQQELVSSKLDKCICVSIALYNLVFYYNR